MVNETRVHPRIQAGDQVASNPLTAIDRHGGYDLIISTSTGWDGFALESSYLGSDQAGYVGIHLVLGRAGHRFAESTRLDLAGPVMWPRVALLDHYAVLQDQLAGATGERVRVDLRDGDLTALRRA